MQAIIEIFSLNKRLLDNRSSLNEATDNLYIFQFKSRHPFLKLLFILAGQRYSKRKKLIREFQKRIFIVLLKCFLITSLRGIWKVLSFSLLWKYVIPTSHIGKIDKVGIYF